MKTLLKDLVPTVLLLAFCGVCSAGPTVVVHPKSAGVTIRDSKFNVVQELRDPKQIKIIQDAFLRAKRVGDTATKLNSPTHKVDFSDRWLVDIHSGEFGLLTKEVTDVYELDAKDFAALKDLLKPKAEQAIGADGEKPPKAYTGRSKHTINLKSPDLRQEGKWGEWRLWYVSKGTRSEGLHGVLVINGKTVSGTTADERIELGGRTLVWHGPWDERKELFSTSGWLPLDISSVYPSWKKTEEPAKSER